MANPEAVLWKYVDRGMSNPQIGWKAQRIESHDTAAGIPDVCYALKKFGFIELKVILSAPADLATEAVYRIPHYTASQRNWIYAYGAAAGGSVFVLLKVMQPCTYFLFDHVSAQSLGRVPFKDLSPMAMITWRDSINFKEMAQLISGK